MLTDTDRAHVRDEIGTIPDDGVLDEWHDELGHWLLVAIRVLKRRLADASAGGQETTSFGLDGVFTVGLSKANLPGMTAQIARLEAQWAALDGDTDPTAASVARLTRPDRYR